MKRRRWFRLPVTDRTLSDRDVAEELDAHMAERVEQLMSAGMSEQDARAEAERRLGGVTRARYALVREAWDRDVRLSLRDRVRSVLEDVRYAARAVSRESGYALVVIVTLALGIGANATMFGLLDRLLLSGPAHVVEPEGIYRFYANTPPQHGGDLNTSRYLNGVVFDALGRRMTSMEHVAAYMASTLTLGAGLDARQLDVVGVTSSYFDVTGVRPVLGRFMTSAEDDVAAERVVVLGHALWQSEYGGRTDVLGEVVQLSGNGYRIIGVAPPGFTGVELSSVDAWVQIAPLAGGELWTTRWIALMLPIVARLRPDASLERAAAEATAAWRAVTADLRGDLSGFSEGYITLAGIGADRSGNEPMEARVARWLMAVAAIVLLVACANVANLYFARGLRRRREIAVRLALGISRGRLIRLFVAESMLLAVIGGAVALVLAYWGAGVVRTVLLPQVDWTTSPLNVRVLGVATAITGIVGIVTGLAPALMASSTRLAPSLAGSVHVPPAPGRMRDVLAVLQAAFCVVLLVGAGVFVRSLWSLNRVDLGLEPDRVMAASFEWQTPPDLSREARASLIERRRVFYRDAAERIAAEPGIENASVAIGAAFRGSWFADIRADGVDSIPSLPGGGPYMSAVTADYFATLGTPVLRGRAFLTTEGAGTDPVAILSRTTAEALWPAADPLDRCVYIGRGADVPCSRVVGVVADMRRFDIKEDPALQVYVPLGQQPGWMSAFTVLARTGVQPETMAEPLRRVLYGMEPSLRFVNVQPFSEYLEPQRRPWKLGAVLFALCGALALSIAIVGLYGVIAYLVVHRRHEIGVRMALGAERGDVVGMVLRQALTLAGIGVLIGVAVAVLAAPYLQPLLFETDARDGAVFGITAATLAAAAIVAGTVPAWRASRVTPTEALREG